MKQIVFIPSVKRNMEILTHDNGYNKPVDLNKVIGFYCMFSEMIMESFSEITFIFSPIDEEDETVINNTVRILKIYKNFSFRYLNIENIYTEEYIILTDNLKLGIFFLNQKINMDVVIYLPYLTDVPKNLRNVCCSHYEVIEKIRNILINDKNNK